MNCEFLFDTFNLRFTRDTSPTIIHKHVLIRFRQMNITDKPNYDYLGDIEEILLKMDGKRYIYAQTQ